MPWQGPISGATTTLQSYLFQALCRLHDLIREHVGRIRMLFILRFLSEVVILTSRREICIQLARAWDKNTRSTFIPGATQFLNTPSNLDH